mmetsp:Transcript_18772/g.38879  ORF Transcript_18772/g.38879 Transcript_18772/m.38879 type:complete len:118 (+) Transcript_18772:3228-3581(+)
MRRLLPCIPHPFCWRRSRPFQAEDHGGKEAALLEEAVGGGMALSSIVWRPFEWLLLYLTLSNRPPSQLKQQQKSRDDCHEVATLVLWFQQGMSLFLCSSSWQQASPPQEQRFKCHVS